MTQPRSAVALGMTVILAGLLTLAGKVVGFVTEYLPAVSSGYQGWPSVQAVFMWTTLLVMLGIRFWLWGHARGTAGAPWMLASAITGLATLLCLTVAPMMVVTTWLIEVVGSALPAIFSVINVGTMLGHAAALLLLGVGLVRWQYVPRWIGWTAVAAGALSSVAVVMLWAQLPGASIVSEFFGWPEAVSLLGLGVALLLTSIRVEGYVRRLAIASLLALAVFVAVTVLAGYAGMHLDAEMRSQEERSQALPRAFARLFPGFKDDRASSGEPDGGEAAAEGTVEQFDLIRGGKAVMPVPFGNRRNLVDPHGPIHGVPVAFEVPGYGTWYLGDNYFLGDEGSEYADIPRDRRLALWDAFAASQRTKVRVLGVFPIEKLHDRNLLGADRYWPADVEGSTIVVYVSEHESAITEELTWSTVDELIINGRAYEQGSQAGAASGASGGAQALLSVAAYRWTDGAWTPVAKRPSFSSAKPTR